MTPPSVPLTPSRQRVVAAGMISTAVGEVTALDAVTVAELLDLVPATILRTIGVEDAESRAILSVLWSG